MLKKAQADGVETIWDRAQAMKPCPIGAEGACCRICSQGPCRVPPPKKAKEGEPQKKQAVGLCGATAETIVARNFARMVCGGAAAHNDHSRGVAKLFKEVAHGEAPGYKIKDVTKLKQIARDYDVAITEGEGDDAKPRSTEVIAQELADKIMGIRPAGRRAGHLRKRAPKKAGGAVAQTGGHAPGLRHRDRGTDAPHPHGGGPGVPQHHQAVHPHRHQ
jgi:anaerobic carbon-monoxide dehydrogenase catalytic subunit